MTADYVAGLVEKIAGEQLDTEQQIDVGRCMLYIDHNLQWLAPHLRAAVVTLFVMNVVRADAPEEAARSTDAPR